ncbi:response regulator [Algivirga pacifica]|uniref:Response regulator transcription factor n=1 Tax=Algivirga pacifica TaxID=1162670 RepID=A0ABP9D310_9BACT
MSKHKVLVIEDEDYLRESLIDMLNFSGEYEVSTARDGLEGIHQIKEVKPDLILCDVMMPRLDGYGVLEYVRSHRTLTNTPFIFLTAKSSLKDIRKGMNQSADDYITKPFEYEDLYDAMTTRLNRIDKIKNEVTELVHETVDRLGSLRGISEQEYQSIEEIRRLKILLDMKNEALDQYCHLNSHKVRGPLCRIMGLIKLMENGEEQSGQLFDMIRESSYELDEVVKEINTVLADAAIST